MTAATYPEVRRAKGRPALREGGGVEAGLLANSGAQPCPTRHAGWPYIFYLNVPIGAAALLLARRLAVNWSA